jgi:hypothetical protein
VRLKNFTFYFLFPSLVILLILLGISLVSDRAGPSNAAAADRAACQTQKSRLPKGKGHDMNTSKAIAESVLRLSAAEYFGEDIDFSEREAQLLDRPFEGLAINVPKVVDLTGQGKLPVAMAICETTLRQWEVYRGKNLVLVAISMDSGRVYVGPALPPPKKEPATEPFSRQPPKPEETPPYTRSAEIMMLQARDRLDLPWKPGRFALAVVNYDWISNVVEVELRGRGEPEKGKLQEIRPAPAALKGSLPCYDILPATPKVSREGVEFVVAMEADKPDSLPVYGAFAVKVRERYIDRSGTVHQGIGGKRLPVGGVVPVTLLVFGLDCKVSLRFDWGVPVYGSAPAEGGLLKGSFAIDALHGSGVRLVPGKYMAYIVCDSRIFGPKGFKVPKKS